LPGLYGPERRQALGDSSRDIERRAVEAKVALIDRRAILEPGSEIAEHPLSVPHVKGLVPGDAVVAEGERGHGRGGEKQGKRRSAARHVGFSKSGV
jgi:hypothetical protein